MKALQQPEKTQKTWKRSSLVFLMLVTVVCASFFMMDRANALYILTGASDSAIVLDDSTETEPLPNFSSQLVYVDTKTTGFEITLKAGNPVTVHYEDADITAQAKGETISALLTRLHITPSPLDMVLVDLSNGIDLTIASDLTYYDHAVESVAYETTRVPSADLPKGTEQVLQTGKNGTRSIVYEVTYSGGELVSRQFVEETDSTAVDEIVAYGTSVSSVDRSDRIANVSSNADGSGVLTFRSGGTMRFSAVKSMTATAYTSGHGGADNYTATGTACQVGTVAVDKNVIPLGTRMYIQTSDGRIIYGVAVAEDTGVRGNIIDLYYDTYAQCISFGRRSCTVYLLK